MIRAENAFLVRLDPVRGQLASYADPVPVILTLNPSK
jgi:hypothetical protein